MNEAARLFVFEQERDDDRHADAARALADAKRIAEALLFASAEPLDESAIAERLSGGVDIAEVLTALRADYEGRGIVLSRAGRKWFFRTADDLAWALTREEFKPKKLTRAAMETLAIVAYHQPVTRAEIEDVRGVAISKGTLDLLLETGWVRLRGRRKSPGRPITYGTTERFLVHFGLEQISDLPGLEELKGAGMFDGRLPKAFAMPQPDDSDALTDDEDPLEMDASEEFVPVAEIAEDAPEIEESSPEDDELDPLA